MVELIATVAILDIVAAIAIPTVNGVIERGPQTASVRDVSTFETDLELSILS